MDATAETARQPPQPGRTTTRSSKRRETASKSERQSAYRSAPETRGGHFYHTSPFRDEPVPDPCTAQTRRWVLLCLASALALDSAIYLVLSSTGSHRRAVEVVANLGGILCFPTILALFFVLMDLCRDEPTLPLTQPLVEDRDKAAGDEVEVRAEERERHVKAIGVDSLRRLAVANQLKASI